MLKIGFDAQATQGRYSGLGMYTKNLLTALQTKLGEAFDLRVYTQTISTQRDFNTLERLYWENVTVPRRARGDKVDILHIPAFAPAFCKHYRLVVTVHDIAEMVFRNQLGKLSAFYWGKWLPFTIRQADCIIANSLHTKNDIIGHLNIKEEKIRVIYQSGHEDFSADIPAASIEEVKKRLGITNRYFLFVGTMEPRKNLGRLLEAFKKLKNNVKEDLQLVLVGSKKFAHGKYAELVTQKYLPDTDSVITPGFLCHDDLNALYCGAIALLFPSLYEGFGIPILEAMGSGCPVLTSNATSMPEVAGDAAILVDPQSTDSILRGMQELNNSPALRSGLTRKGFEQIKKFSWDRAAGQILEVYQSLI